MSRVTHIDSRRFTRTDLSRDERVLILSGDDGKRERCKVLAAELGSDPEAMFFD